MNKKQLEIELSKLKDYTNKKPSLEQYTTPSSIAASLLWRAFMNNDIKDKVVLDAGCGNGVLGIGALLLEAKRVIFVDVDAKAIDVVKENCTDSGLTNFELINANIVDVDIKADIVVMNPPFGVQTPLLDIMFLKQSVKLGSKVYLIYKSDGLKIIEKELFNYKAIILEKAKLPIKRQFSYHTKNKNNTGVILVQIL